MVGGCWGVAAGHDPFLFSWWFVLPLLGYRSLGAGVGGLRPTAGGLCGRDFWAAVDRRGARQRHPPVRYLRWWRQWIIWILWDGGFVVKGGVAVTIRRW